MKRKIFMVGIMAAVMIGTISLPCNSVTGIQAAVIKAQPKVRNLNSAEIEVFRSKLYSSINAYRKSNKRKTLSKNTTLQKSATLRAKELPKKYSHTRPNGKSCFTVFSSRSIGTTNGENLTKVTFVAKSSYSTVMLNNMVESVMKALKKSSSHRQIMLNSKYTKNGIGIYAVKNGNTITLYSAQHFSNKT